MSATAALAFGLLALVSGAALAVGLGAILLDLAFDWGLGDWWTIRPLALGLIGGTIGLATIDVRVGSLRIRYRRIRETLTWEPYLQFEGAEVVKLAGLTVIERPATLDEAMWAGVPRV